MPPITRLQSGNNSLLRRLGYKPNVPQNYLNASTPTSKERSQTLAATATTSTIRDRTSSNLLPPQYPPPPPPTEPGRNSDDIGQQFETLNADSSSTELYIPPSPARSTLYATATHTTSSAGALTATTSTTLQPVMIALPTLTSHQQIIPSSSQQLPAQHHSLPEHQTSLTGQQITGQHIFIPPAPATYQSPVPIQVPVQSQTSTPTPTPPPRANISLEKYDGKTSAIQFWTQFMTFISIMNVPLDAAHTYFSFYLKDTAKDWYFQLTPAVQNSLSELKSAFLARFRPQVPFSLGLVDITQQNTESVDQYISRIRKLSTDSTMPEDCLTTMIMKGLKPAIRNIVMPQFPQTIDDLRTKSAIAEMTVLMNNQSLSSATSDNSVVNAMSAVCEVTNQLQQTIAAMRTTPPNTMQYHQDTASQPEPGYSHRDPRQANRYRGPPPQQSHPTQWQQRPRQSFSQQQQQRGAQTGPQQSPRFCRNCGSKSCFSKFNCPARGHFCQKCGKSNHFENRCITSFLDNSNHSH